MLKKIFVLFAMAFLVAKAAVCADIGNINTVGERKAISLYGKNYKPKFIQEIKLDAAQVVLADGTVFKHAGFGATIGFKGKRLNYTGENNTGLIGFFLLDENGNLFIERVEFEYVKSKDPYQPDWKLIESETARVKEINWDFKNLRKEFMDSSCRRCQN